MHADAIIIGTGQGGVPLATRLAEAGRRVILFERGHVGGTCVNVGCTPTKTMVASARAAHVARNAGRLGVNTGRIKIDLAAIVDRKNQIVEQWRNGSERRIASHGEGLSLVRGHARLVGEREVEANGQRYRAETIILNTGGRPVVPSIPGLDAVPYLDNASLMDERHVPKHLVIIGGGYIACEFGQMFRRFGSKVTILQRGPHLLDREDEDISVAIEEVFHNEGIEVRLGVETKEVSHKDSKVLVRLRKGPSARGSHLMVAVGRDPNTEDLGCETAGVQLTERGAVVVNGSYQTSAPGIYAIGDVIGGPQFTHTSWDDHRLLFDHLMGGTSRPRTQRLIPYVVFTDPQVARVGLSEREAIERGIPFEMATMPFGHVARAIELDETAGLMKVLVDPKTERFLGAAIVGAQAGELIHVFSNLMEAGASARSMVTVQHAHPTFAEGLQTLVMKLERFALSKPAVAQPTV